MPKTLKDSIADHIDALAAATSDLAVDHLTQTQRSPNDSQADYLRNALVGLTSLKVVLRDLALAIREADTISRANRLLADKRRSLKHDAGRARLTGQVGLADAIEGVVALLS